MEAEQRNKLMRYYCTLIVRSNSQHTDTSIFRSDVADVLEFEDTRSEANLARAARWRSNGLSAQFLVQNDLPRFCWSLNSIRGVDASNSDLHAHVSWLLSQLNSGISLAAAGKDDVQGVLSFYWGGQGTGGGPTITPRLAALLCQHGINLNVGFYFEEV